MVALRESCFSSEDFREGVHAFREKRPPEVERAMSAKGAPRAGRRPTRRWRR